MENVNINWEDPVFGYIPEEFRDWYLKTSGTFWNNARKDWFISKNQRVGDMLKATKFQNDIEEARNTIISNMPEGSFYMIGHSNIFGIMMNTKTELEYIFQGEKFIQNIGF
jgi:hypothetical protein